MGDRVKRVKTEVSESQMAQAIIGSWKQLFGNAPTKEQVGLVMAQNSLETGHRKNMWNFNVGNLTTDGKGTYDFYDDLTTKEQVKPGFWEQKNLKYRAYSSLVDGVKDYLKLLSGKRYSKAWDNIMHPDPVAFSKALKESGYYTADEAPYTKNIASLYKQFGNSNSYEKAMSGKVDPVMPGKPVDKDEFQKYLTRNNKGTEMDVFKELADRMQPANQQTSTAPQLDSVLNNFLQMVAASEKQNKKLYKKYLPMNHVVIGMSSSDYTNTVEFATILCSALDEELVANSFIHTNGSQVEVECAIPGPPKDCFEAVNQLTSVLVGTFEDATSKIGGLQIKTQIITNKKSSYQQISLTAAETHHRKFLLKFI